MGYEVVHQATHESQGDEDDQEKDQASLQRFTFAIPLQIAAGRLKFRRILLELS